jgi:hypothetical protein
MTHFNPNSSLYASHGGGSRHLYNCHSGNFQTTTVPTSSACAGASVPPTVSVIPIQASLIGINMGAVGDASDVVHVTSQLSV